MDVTKRGWLYSIWAAALIMYSHKTQKASWQEIREPSSNSLATELKIKGDLKIAMICVDGS